ncbi:MAG: DUF2608 domain-containing protein [Bdellovibrionales bacterium]|nr:DUF2608 domain-containing protein [Bdellovibrionales bacterium]MBT3525348.1 DUF2608 domain-containing protein [Bdellovibrionales bacterium]MBT7668989.1 DUF2608 domain-containing protein [Bdellovibrionales bacterium]
MKLLLIIFITTLQLNLWASGTLATTERFQDVENRVDQLLASGVPAKQILMVYDIDNTLLAMNQNLGSDQWFNWQSSLLGQSSSDAAATDFSGLLDAQHLLFMVSKMHPPESEIPQLVKRLQERKLTSIVLTSRGSDYRNVTERELKRNGYSFKQTAIGPFGGFPSTYLPYQLENPADDGLSIQEVEQFKLKNARPVSYMDGVYMTAGQHKGIMLKVLLHKSRANFSHIIFVDDHKKHTDRMIAAMKDHSHVYAFHYVKEQGVVNEFSQGPKDQEVDGWKDLQEIISRYFF